MDRITCRKIRTFTPRDVDQHIMHSECYRCGKLHIRGICHASSSRCHKCFKVGHFARVCQNTKKKKSNSLKLRDSERMTVFIRKKTFECALPFYLVNNEYLTQNITNSSNSAQTTLLLADIHDLEMENGLLALDNEEIAFQNKELQHKLTQAKNELKSKCEENNTLETKIENRLLDLSKYENEHKTLQEEYKIRKKQQEHLQTSLQENLIQLKLKTDEVKTLTRELRKAETEILSRQRHIETLSCEMDALNELTVSLEDHTGAKLKGFSLYKALKYHTSLLIHTKQTRENEIDSLNRKNINLEETNNDLLTRLESNQEEHYQQGMHCQSSACNSTKQKHLNKPVGAFARRRNHHRK